LCAHRELPVRRRPEEIHSALDINVYADTLGETFFA
jgi:hypothetical protein